MFPQSEIIKILGHLKRKYKDAFYYKMKFGEVDIDIVNFYGMYSEKRVTTKTFTFDEVLSWHRNPEREFERSWKSK